MRCRIASRLQGAHGFHPNNRLSGLRSFKGVYTKGSFKGSIGFYEGFRALGLRAKFRIYGFRALGLRAKFRVYGFRGLGFGGVGFRGLEPSFTMLYTMMHLPYRTKPYCTMLYYATIYSKNP